MTIVATYPLIKIPLIVLNIISLRLAVYQPNPVPPEKKTLSGKPDEPHIVSSWEALCLRFVTVNTMMTLVQLGWTTGAGIEIAVIVASLFPYNPLSSLILSTLSSPKSPTPYITPLFIVGLLLNLSGMALRRWCYRVLGEFFTFEVTLKDGHRLMKTGPYAFVRHPSYIGLVGVWLGLLIAYMSPGSWFAATLANADYSNIFDVGKVILACMAPLPQAVIVGTMIARTAREDNILQGQFGQEWAEWAEKVPYMLVPGIY